MKLFLALAFLSAASAAKNPFAPTKQSKNKAANAQYVRKLTSGATATKNSQLRRLEEDDDFEVDISGYSVKFEQCQFVKSYNAEMAEEQDATTVLATSRFVLFRLCPSAYGCSSCNTGYGEYLVDLESYLEATVEYFQTYQEEMCETCEENCYNQANEDENEDEEEQQDEEEDNQDENGEDRRKLAGRKLAYTVDCDTCWDECQKIENMEENGYLDATEFLECAMIYDPEDDNKAALYAGPICASSGSKIKIGVFSDENCMYLDSSKDVDDYLVDDDGVSMHLSHALLKSTYTDTCISCKEPVEEDDNEDGDDENGNDEEDADEVTEMCEQLYEDAAKCETLHGMESGTAAYYQYENQLAQEETICDFMQSLKSGTYDEEGEIIVSGSNSYRNGGKSTTGGQKFALTFFILGTVGLAAYAAMLHSKLVKGGKTDLSSTGGAMA
jgi:hypothetical protein